MKIIILGAGFGGLSAYHTLKKHLVDTPDPISITIVDAREGPSFPAAGALTFAPNGLRAIGSFSSPALQDIQQHSFPGSQVSFCNSGGTYLGAMPFGRKERYGYEMSMAPRSAILDALSSGINHDDVRWNSKAVAVRELGSQVAVEFGDGSVEMADLVIGADGAQSVTRNSLFKGKQQAQYNGLAGISGIIDVNLLPARLQESFKDHGATITFGKRGFFGYSMCSPTGVGEETKHTKSFMQWWSAYESPSIPDNKEIDYEDAKAKLLAVYGDWKSPFDEPDTEKGGAGGVFRRIIELGCRPPSQTSSWPSSHLSDVSQSDKSLPFAHARFATLRLDHWSNATAPGTPSESQGRIVLIGDAAHIIQADTAQGASCAVEDAVVYALLLKHYISALARPAPLITSEKSSSAAILNTSANPFALAAKAYEEVRKPRIKAIFDMMGRGGCDTRMEMGWIGETLRDFAIRWLSKAPESMNDYLFAYDSEVEVTEYLKKRASGRCGF